MFQAYRGLEESKYLPAVQGWIENSRDEQRTGEGISWRRRK